MRTIETVRALHELRLPGMAKSWEALSETHRIDKLSLRDGMELLIQAERDTRTDNRIVRLIHNAHFSDWKRTPQGGYPRHWSPTSPPETTLTTP